MCGLTPGGMIKLKGAVTAIGLAYVQNKAKLETPNDGVVAYSTCSQVHVIISWLCRLEYRFYCCPLIWVSSFQSFNYIHCLIPYIEHIRHYPVLIHYTVLRSSDPSTTQQEIMTTFSVPFRLAVVSKTSTSQRTMPRMQIISMVPAALATSNGVSLWSCPCQSRAAGTVPANRDPKRVRFFVFFVSFFDFFGFVLLQNKEYNFA